MFISFFVKRLQHISFFKITSRIKNEDVKKKKSRLKGSFLRINRRKKKVGSQSLPVGAL